MLISLRHFVNIDQVVLKYSEFVLPELPEIICIGMPWEWNPKMPSAGIAPY